MFFFFNDTATTEIYTLSLHDALPICLYRGGLCHVTASRERALVHTATLKFPSVDVASGLVRQSPLLRRLTGPSQSVQIRSEEHTSELQSRQYIVCRLLLEKKKNKEYS